jgi:hypothetical protein
MKQPYAVRKMLTAEEMRFSSDRFGVDRLKQITRRDLYDHLESGLDNIMDYVIMFNEEEITDREHYNYGGVIVGALAYPKANFNGGAFQ